MFYLLLAVVCSVLLGFIFKLFSRWGVDGFQAILFNYFTCVCCGWLQLGRFPVAAEGWGAPWIPYALVLGGVFISGFNCASLTVRNFGVTISQIMQRMSILITVPFALLAYGESSGPGKLLGIFLALASIVFVNWPAPAPEKEKTETLRRSGRLWLPFFTWILAGILEVLFIRVQREGLVEPGNPSFICTVFGAAGILGLAIAIPGWMSRRLHFAWRNVLAGVLLGIPNYGSMLFLLQALGSGLEGSFVFPATNVGIILLTTIGAVWLFEEKLSKINWAGIALAVAAIALISF